MSFRILRSAAREDLRSALIHYARVASTDVCFAFSLAAEEATQHILAHPQSGSPRMQGDRRFPNLRVWPISGFPFVAFYIVTASGPEILRVLHTSRDVEAILID